MTLGDEAKLECRYDLFIAQHRVVSEYIYSTQKRFSSILSQFLDQQMSMKVCFFGYLSNGIITVSNQIKAHLENTAQANERQFPPIHAFPNNCTSPFYSFNYHGNNSLERICCISNHPAPECLEAFELLRNDRIKADVFGYQSHSVEVTLELLSQYEVVVSIGRTERECMSMGLPLYCYDHFGGPGYININNIEHNTYFNFSGRPERQKRSAQWLYADLINSYAKTKEMQNQIRD